MELPCLRTILSINTAFFNDKATICGWKSQERLFEGMVKPLYHRSLVHKWLYHLPDNFHRYNFHGYEPWDCKLRACSGDHSPGQVKAYSNNIFWSWSMLVDLQVFKSALPTDWQSSYKLHFQQQTAIRESAVVRANITFLESLWILPGACPLPVLWALGTSFCIYCCSNYMWKFPLPITLQ